MKHKNVEQEKNNFTRSKTNPPVFDHPPSYEGGIWGVQKRAGKNLSKCSVPETELGSEVYQRNDHEIINFSISHYYCRSLKLLPAFRLCATIDSKIETGGGCLRVCLEYRGLSALKRFITGYRTMFPDFKLVPEEIFYVGDRAIIRWIVSGTHTGPGFLAPTGKQFTLSGMSLCRFKDGRLIEDKAESDGLYFMEQLGYSLIPPKK
jgi:predicted ester cyclase